MKFLTLSSREIKNSAIYNNIKEKHLVISITSGEDEEIVLPHNLNRVSQLFLKFDDVQDIDNRFVYFDRSMAEEILHFVDKNLTSVSLIIVQCQAGLSRSVAVAAALSKIINYADDAIYTSGIPNMFVYVTLLDCLFGNKYWRKEFPKMALQRNNNMACYVSPGVARLHLNQENKRLQDIDF